MGKRISIVLPTFNERKNLPLVLSRLNRALKSYDWKGVVVDDNSPDGTGGLARKLKKKYPLKVIIRKKEKGLGSAIVRGIEEARAEVVGVMDTDLQHPPEAVPSLLKALEKGADLAVGSRYKKEGGVSGWGLARRSVSRLSIFVAHLVLPQTKSIKDPVSGFFFFKKRLVKEMEFEALSWKVVLEILVRTEPGKVVEVPYTFKKRKKGKTKLGFEQTLDYLYLLWKLRKR